MRNQFSALRFFGMMALFVLCSGSTLWAQVAAKPAPTAAPAATPAGQPAGTLVTPSIPVPQKPTLEQYIQDEVSRSAEEGGFLAHNPQGKKVLEDEVLPHGDVFIVNYRATPDGTTVQVDRTKLKNYILFSAKSFRDETNKDPMVLCVLVKAQTDCAECELYRAPLQDAYHERFGRRGFVVRNGPDLATDLSQDSLVRGEKAFEEYTVRAFGGSGEGPNVSPTPSASQAALAPTSLHRCDAAFYAEITKDSNADDRETVTALRSNSFLEVREKADKKRRSRGDAVFTVSKIVELDPLAAGAGGTGEQKKPKKEVVSLILARQTSELLGSSAMSVNLLSNLHKNAEKLIKLEHVENFESYNKFKQKVMQGVPGVVLEERVISPGSVHFAVTSTTSMEAISRVLQRLDWGAQKIEVLKVTSEEISVAFK